MTGARRVKTLILSVVAFVVILLTALVSVSFASWVSDGSSSVETSGNVGLFYIEFEDGMTVRTSNVNVVGGKEYSSYICVSSTGELSAGTVYIKFETSDVSNATGTFSLMIERTPTDADGVPTSGSKTQMFYGEQMTAADLSKKYIQLDFGSGADRYYALDFVVNAVSGEVAFTFNAIMTTVKPVSAQITFNLNYDDGATYRVLDANSDNSVPRPEEPIRPDYVFGGWYEDSSCTSFWNFTTGRVDADKTLYARWHRFTDINTAWYAVVNGELIRMRFNKNPYGDGYADEFMATAVLKEYDELRFLVDGIALPFELSDIADNALIKSGSDNFATVAAGVNGAFTLYYRIKNDKTQCALNTTNGATFVVSFDANGGYFNGNKAFTVQEKIINHDNSVPRPDQEPTKDKDYWSWDGGGMEVFYVFGGWYEDSACTKFWNFNTDRVSADKTLYAKWHYKHLLGNAWYAVVNGELVNMGYFGYAGGKFEDEFSVIVDLEASDELRFFIDGDVPSYGLGDESGNSNSNVEKEESDNYATVKTSGRYRLRFRANSNHTEGQLNVFAVGNIVTYKMNDGSDATFEVHEINGDNSLPRPADPTRAGYVFGGWFSDSDCTEFWRFYTDKSTEDKTLYAKWYLKSDLDKEWYAVVNGELKRMDHYQHIGQEFEDEFFVAVDLHEGDELRFFVDGDVPKYINETENNILKYSYNDYYCISRVNGLIGLYFKASEDHTNGALAAVRVTPVTFDYGDGNSVVKYVDEGKAAEDPNTGANNEIIVWHKADGTVWAFETVVTEEMTLYAEKVTLQIQSLYVRYGNDANYNDIKFTKLDGDIAATYTNEATVWLNAGDHVYVYNTWNAHTPRSLNYVDGFTVSSGKTYAVVQKSGMYTLQFTQHGSGDESDYSLVVADYWAVQSVNLSSGTYAYIMDEALEAANRFVKFETVGYIEDGKASAGIAAILKNISANTQIKLVNVALGGAVTLAKISLTGIYDEGSGDSFVINGLALSSFRNVYATIINDHTTGGAYGERFAGSIISLKSDNTYRVSLSGTSVEVLPAVGLNSYDFATEDGYYVVGSFSDYEVLAANKLGDTDMEGVSVTNGLTVSRGAVYRIVRVQVGSDIVITRYASNYAVNNSGNDITTLYYDEWTGTVYTSIDFYRIIVDGVSSAPSIMYRSDLFGTDTSFGSDVKFAQTPGGGNSYYADVPSLYNIASLTLSDGVEANMLTGDSAFTYTVGKSYRLETVTPTGKTKTASNVDDGKVYIRGVITSISSWDWGQGYVYDVANDSDYAFLNIYLQGDDNFKIYYFDNNNGYWIGTLDSNNSDDGLSNRWDGNVIVNKPGVYTLVFHKNGNDSTISYTYVPYETKLTYAGGSVATFGWTNSIVYNYGGTVRNIALDTPTSSGFYQTELYTHSSKANAANYIVAGTDFMLYHNGVRVQAKMYSANELVDDIYRVKRNGYIYTISSETVKVNGKFTIGVAPGGKAVSVGFTGGDAAIENAITTGSSANSGWYVVGTFSNWQAFAANKMKATNVEGIYKATLDFVVADSKVFTQYKIVYVPTSGTNFTWYGTGGTTYGDNIEVSSTEFYVDTFKTGTSGMYRSDLNLFRVLFSQYKTISGKSLDGKTPQIKINNTTYTMTWIRDDNATESRVFYYDYSNTLTTTVVISFTSPHSSNNIWQSTGMASSKFAKGYSYFVEADYLGNWDWWDLTWSPTVKRYNGSSYSTTV